MREYVTDEHLAQRLRTIERRLLQMRAQAIDISYRLPVLAREAGEVSHLLGQVIDLLEPSEHEGDENKAAIVGHQMPLG